MVNVVAFVKWQFFKWNEMKAFVSFIRKFLLLYIFSLRIYLKQHNWLSLSPLALCKLHTSMNNWPFHIHIRKGLVMSTYGIKKAILIINSTCQTYLLPKKYLCGERNICVVEEMSVWWKKYLCGERNVCVAKEISVWWRKCLCGERNVCLVEEMSGGTN